MRWMALVATLAWLVLGVSPVVAGVCPDSDGDGFTDCADNCSDSYNPGQDDTDGDLCGNRCDADYDQSGLVGYSDWGLFSPAFGGFDLDFDHTEPVIGPVGFGDFGVFASLFGSFPGPSGLSVGAPECP